MQIFVWHHPAFEKLCSWEIQQGAAVHDRLPAPVTNTDLFHGSGGVCVSSTSLVVGVCSQAVVTHTPDGVDCCGMWIFACSQLLSVCFPFVWTLASHRHVWVACIHGIKLSMFWQRSCTGSLTDVATVSSLSRYSNIFKCGNKIELPRFVLLIFECLMRM